MRRKGVYLSMAVVLIAVIMASSAQAMSSDNYAISWMVPVSGGGGAAASASYAVNLTYGQTAGGAATSPGYTAGLGYWYVILQEWGVRGWRLLVPLILRGAPQTRQPSRPQCAGAMCSCSAQAARM